MGTNKQREQTFRFKQFSVNNSQSAMKVGTDGVLLGAWVNGAGCRRGLDVGCGTGLIALMLSQRYADLHMTGVEIDPPAADEARQNVAASPWADRIEIVCGDFCSIGAEADYDLIVSNPPFFVDALRSDDSQRMAARHAMTLDYKVLIERSTKLLLRGGRLAMVLPAEFEADVCFRASLSRMSVSRMTRVFTKPTAPCKRILVEIVNDPTTATTLDTLTIGSEEYRTLTGEFYLG